MSISKNLRSPKAWMISILSVAGVWLVAYVVTKDAKVASVVAGGFVVLGFIGALVT